MREKAELALDHGKPVRRTMLPYARHSIGESDVRAVVRVLRSNWITTGPKVDEFERAFAKYVGAKYAVSFSSGTSALHGAVFAAGLCIGDEAITSPMTFCATANCIVYQGATPVFADVSPDTLNIDAANVAKRLTQRSKAILAVDYAGHPADLEVLLELARRHELVLIEDACHALGAEYKGKRVGGISDMTVFSFHPAKHITTGEGGMVTTDNAGFAERLRIFRNHGIDRDARRRAVEGQWYYEMIDLGYNYRLTDIGCALGLSQLRRIGPNLSRRRKIAADYAAAFRHQRGIVLPSVRRSARPSWHLYPIRLDSAELSVRRDEVFRALRAEGIGVNVHYIPVHLHPYYRERFGYRGGEYPIAEDAYRHLITLPMFHGMTDRDVDDVIRAVIKVVDHYAA